jgi:hypothetical protein
MLLIFKDLKSCLRFSVSVIARLDRSPLATRPHSGGLAEESRGEAIQKKELDYPVNPPKAEDNDNHWNRVRYE